MSCRIKVLLWHWGRRGGGPRYTLEVARYLSSHKDIKLYLSISRQSEFYCDFDFISPDVRFDIDTYSSLSQFIMNSFSLQNIGRQFSDFIERNCIDVVFCTMDHLWNIFMFSGIHKNKALYLLTVHDAMRHPGEDQIWRRLLLSSDIKNSDGALVLSKSVGLNLNKLYKYPSDRIFESAHGHFGQYILEKGRKFPTDRPIRILFFGRILPYKGLKLLLEALVILKNFFPEIELQIWGGGDISAYKEKIYSIGNVKVENRWIDECEVPWIFQNTDILVLPYSEASQSGVFSTSMAYGMPCVATPVPGLCDQISHGVNGLIVKDFEPLTLAKNILRLIESPDLYEQLSQGCLKTAREDLSWDVIGDSIVNAIKSLKILGARSRGK